MVDPNEKHTGGKAYADTRGCVFTAAEEETVSGKETNEDTIHGKSHSNEN